MLNPKAGRRSEPGFRVRIGGLTVDSELELTGLAPVPETERTTPADVRFVIGAVPSRLRPEPSVSGGIEVDADRCLLSIGRVARYLVSRGTEVRVQPLSGAAPRDVRLFLLGTAFGALCYQRGLLPLHASAVRVGDACAAFVGDSGAGKSTLAAFLLRRGYAPLCDDLLVVGRGAEGLLAYPGPPRLKLWRDGLVAMGADPERLERDRSGMEKYLLPIEAGSGLAPLPLRWVFVLGDGEAESVVIEPLRGLEALTVLTNMSYRPGLVRAMGLIGPHFGRCAMLAEETRIGRLRRPRGLTYMEDVLDSLERGWETGGSWASASEVSA